MAKGDIESTPLWADIESVIYSGPKDVKYDYAALVHTQDNDFNIFKIIHIEEKCDYQSEIGPSMKISFQIGLGDYVYKLYPFRDNLEITIKRIPQNERGGTIAEADVETRRYKANLVLGKNPQITGERLANQSYTDLNTSHIQDVYMELLDRNFETVRTKTFPGGSIVGKPAKDTIFALLMGESKNILIDGKAPVDGIDLVEPDNKEPIKHLFLESGMRAAYIPTYLQNEALGVYSTGIGTFFQRYKDKYYWYVYPLYKPARFDEDVDRLVIYAVPEERMPGIDRTYRTEGKVTYIVVTGSKSYIDSGKISDLNAGVGFRMPDANAMMKKPVKVTEEGPKGDRARLNSEVAGRERKDGNIYAPVLHASANPYKQYSDIARRQLARVDLVWENSDSEKVYPGMPCKYVFMDKDEYKEKRGIVIGKYTVRELIGKPTLSNTYRTSTHLAIMLEPFDDYNAQPKMDSAGTF